jgi:transcriptional antiterminator Rof (Rho-off)
MTTDYRPVDCSLYDRYELAIMRRCPLMLGWRDEAGQSHLEPVAPLDLRTAAGEEFLVFLTAAGRRQSVRLDRIREIRELPARP